MSPKIVSIYAGVGGIDAGFKTAGFKTVFASDIWDKACESLRANFSDTEVICDDIVNLDFTLLRKKYHPIDGLVGGPPCPPFSKSRFYRKEKSRGLEDSNGALTLFHYLRALEELRPKFFFFENVHGFVYKPHKAALALLETETKKLGYKVHYSVVDAADFGVPQNRKRFICVGVQKHMDDFKYPKPTHSNPKCSLQETGNWITCGTVLKDIDYDLPEDAKMQAGSKHKDLLQQVPPGDNYLFFTKERNHPTPLFRWRARYWSFLLKLSPDRPSWTIQASHSNNMGPFHWKNRFLRISEIKRLQSFDDSYILVGNYKEKWRQIGNAVPPRLAVAFARQLQKQYF